jgi:hypothetical protein
MSWLKQAVWVGLFATLATSAVWAAEEKKDALDAAKPAAEAKADDIPQLIKQLDADKFSDRQAASEKLFTAGKLAIPALIEAASGDSQEVTVRSIDLLQRFMDSEDQSVKDAAKDGLEKIAKSENTNAVRRAKQVLNPKEDQQPQGPMGMGMLMPIGGVKQVSVSNVNGVTTINAVEGDKKTTITKNPDGGIQMDITEKVNGKDVTKKFKAKNADELKKKSPKAYEAYKEYAENNPLGGMQVNFGAGGGMGPGAMPAMPALPAQLGNFPGLQLQGIGPGGALNGSDDLGEALKTWNDSLKTMNADLEPEKLSPETKKEMKDQIEAMKKQLDKLEKRLEKPVEKPKK